MKIAIVTGASSGLGRELARQLPTLYPEVEAIWLIARRRDRLEALAAALELPAVCMDLDLCDPISFTALQKKLAAEQPEVTLLANCAGCGYLGNVGEAETALQTRMIDLNLRALTAVTSLTLPYIPRGGRIVNVSSIAAFCPTPRLTVYSAGKAYVSAFTIGLAEELRCKGISVTAVCPGPMHTEFCDVGGITGNSRAFATLPYCDQVRVAHGTLLAARSRRTIYTPTGFYKIYRLLAKLTPVKLAVKFSKC